MKKSTFILICLSVAMYSIANNLKAADNIDVQVSSSNSMNIISTTDLNNLVLKWVNDYNNLHPETNVNLISSSASSISDLVDKNVNIGIFSGSYQNQIDFHDASYRKLVAGRDIIVPIINTQNPLIDKLSTEGVSSEKLATVFNNNDKENLQLNFYYTDDEIVFQSISRFLNIEENKIKGIKKENTSSLIRAVQNDMSALSFCRLIDIVDIEKDELIENICILPIDKNGNGELDYMERIYSSLNDFKKGVWIGKYPKELINNLYVIYNVNNINDAEADLLKWIITTGQKDLFSNGFNELTQNERYSNTLKITSDISLISSAEGNKALPKYILTILISIVALVILIDVLIRLVRRKRAVAIHIESASLAGFNGDAVSLPKGLFFDKSYTWAYMEKDGEVKIGITDFLKHITGNISQIKMKNDGEKISKGNPAFTIIQDGKQLNIKSPVSGTILKTNQDLTKNISQINKSPYSDGWIYAIEPSNWMNEIQILNMANKYREWLKNEFTRLKDFLTNVIKSHSIESLVVFQDGGLIKDGVLSDFGPELWEDFQLKFIDTSN